MPAKRKHIEIPEPLYPPTHFTIEEARRAVLEVMEEDRIAREAAKRAKRHRGGASTRGGSAA